MIELDAMQTNQYTDYLDYFIPDYSTEIAANYGLTPAEASLQARSEINAQLPDGVHTSGQVLLCLYLPHGETRRLIGYLWYKPDFSARSAFIYDFHILNDYQGKGLAKSSIAALESKLKSEGITLIKLRVAGDNERARRLYHQTGFAVTGINMSKFIGSASRQGE